MKFCDLATKKGTLILQNIFLGKKIVRSQHNSRREKKVEFAISKNFYFAFWPVPKPMFFFRANVFQKALKN